METLVSYKIVKLAKKKGIDFRKEPFKRYIYTQKAGTYHAYITQDALRTYLRDTFKINIVIVPSFKCYNILYISQYNELEDENEDFNLEGLDFKDFTSYEEALEAALIEILTQLL